MSLELVKYRIKYSMAESILILWPKRLWPNRPAPFQWGSCYSILSFICMFCWSLFVLSFFFFFFLAIVLSVLLGYTDSDYPFGVFKLFLLSNLFCRSVNVMDMLNSAPRRKRSHDHGHYASLMLHDVSLNYLLPFMQKPLGMHTWVCITFARNYFHYLFRNYISCTTRVWKTTLQMRIKMNTCTNLQQSALILLSQNWH